MNESNGNEKIRKIVISLFEKFPSLYLFVVSPLLFVIYIHIVKLLNGKIGKVNYLRC